MPQESPTSPGSQSLGQFLANIRLMKRMTLREVEEATEGTVSNAYLSQLEHERINKPSPNILHRLAEVYAVSYTTLMQKAGYIVETSRDSGPKRRRNMAPTFATGDLTPDEEEALLEYLAFLRSRRGKSQ